MKLEEEINLVPGCHANFHLRHQLDRSFLEMPFDSSTARKFALKANNVINTLQLLDPGCSKLLGKYMKLLATAQQMVLMEMMGKMKPGEVMGAMRELTATMLQASKMISDYCIESK